MKKIVLLFSACLWIIQLYAQNRHPQHALHEHPEMYAKDTIHIDGDSTHYTIDNLGPAVNKGHKSAGGRVSPDGKFLYFFKVGDSLNLKGTRDIWLSEFNTQDSSWHQAWPMPEPVNNYGDNLVHWISKDNKKLLLHNRYLKNKMSISGLSMTELQPDGKWTFPKKIKIKKYRNKELCSFEMSPDEEVLISAIMQPGNTFGLQDLYVSFRIGQNKYSKPVNMGNVINTKGIEATAFLAPDGKTLYFSSNGHKGSLGGFDIYESKRLDDTWTKWSKPKHIGAPFNTKDDDMYFSVPDSGDYVYLSRHFGGGADSNAYSDIIRIRLKELEPAYLLSGNVTSKYLNKKIPATIKIVKLTDGIPVRDSLQTDTAKPYLTQLTGRTKFVVIVESPEHIPIYDTINLADARPGRYEKTKNYDLQIISAFLGKIYSGKDSLTPIQAKVSFFKKETKELLFTKELLPADSAFKVYASNGKFTYSIISEGYLKDTNEFEMLTLDDARRVNKNFYLKKIEKGLTFTIKNILFKYNSHVLEPYSFWELDRIADILDASPFLEVEIGGHTDNVGQDAYNMALSQRRAHSVVSYLKSKGVKNPITSKGYGETRPIETNLNPQGRAINRRVEFVVLNVGEDPNLLYKPTELKPGEVPPEDIADPTKITK